MSGGEGKNVGFGFAKKKKSVVVGVHARGEDDDDGEDGDAPQREYLTGVSGSGLELKDKKPASAPKSIPVQDNTFEVGTGRRRKAPSFLPTEEEIVKDDERFETAERIGGKGETAQAGDVQYGLTKMGPKDGDARSGDGAAARGAQDSFIGKSLAEKELQAFKEDVEDLPEQSTMEDYESMPIEDFGAAISGLVQHEIRDLGAVLIEAHFVKEVRAKARALDRLEEHFRDNHIRVDIGTKVRSHQTIKISKLFHYLNSQLRTSTKCPVTAAAAAIASSSRNQAIDHRTMLFGEIGLVGEVRAVSHPGQRLIEAKRHGFTTVIAPKSAIKHAPEGIKVIGVRTLRQALGQLFLSSES